MSQHKYNDAYNKGFEDGKKKAFDNWVYQCYDELSPKEQIELLLSEGAELPRKAVIKALEDVRAEIIILSDKADQECKVSNSYSVRDRLRTKAQAYDDVAKMIGRKIAEAKGEQK